MNAEQILARQREQAKARKARYHAKNPKAHAAYRDRYARAEKVLRDRHHDEYLTIARTLRAAKGDKLARADWNQSYRDATAELRRRYPDEWADVLAATS